MNDLFPEKKVLIIEDEPKLQRLMREFLEAEGYVVLEASTAEQALEEAIRSQPDAVLLDLDIPGNQGMAVLKRLREWSQMPILVMSVRNNEAEKVSAFDNGANDFITRPFSTPELLARLRAARRIAQPAAKRAAVFRTGSLTVELTHRIVRVGKRIVRLTATEYAILHVFVRNAGKVVTHTQILAEVWGTKMADKMDCLRVYLNFLRKKLERDPGEPELLLTEPAVGYRLVVRK